MAVLDQDVPKASDDGYYGKANGPGPWHLLTGDHAATLCGVKRFNTYRHSLVGLWNPDAAVCVNCRREHRRRTRPEVQQSEVNAAVARATAAINDMQAAREHLAAALPVLRAAGTQAFDECLYWAHEGGYTLAELGGIVGLTRERVRQRIAAHLHACGDTVPSRGSTAGALAPTWQAG